MNFKKILSAALVAVMAFAGTTTATAQATSPSTKWHWDKGTIVVDAQLRTLNSSFGWTEIFSFSI